MRTRLVLLTCLLAITACSEATAPPPAAVAITEDAVGYYCQMLVLEHDGPKAQIHVAGRDHPLWFAQVRDAIAFLRSPEETEQVRAVYVNDMSRAKSWADPGTDNWIAAEDVSFVIGSKMTGGMGAPEAIPFGDEADAKAYIARNGGRLVRLDDIPDDYVLAPVNVSDAMTPRPGANTQTESHDMQSHEMQSHGVSANETQTQ